jgi:hypothetical protein
MPASSASLARERRTETATMEEPDFGRQEVRGMNAPIEEPRNANPEDSGAGGTTPANPQGPTPTAPPQQPPYANADSGPAPRWTSAMDPRRKSVALASILSCMPGLGQVYVGYYHLGFIYILVVTGLITICTTPH